MSWDSILYPTEEKYTNLYRFIKWSMDLLQINFKIYLYPVDKTITLTHLHNKMILDFFYLEMIFLLTPEPY